MKYKVLGTLSIKDNTVVAIEGDGKGFYNGMMINDGKYKILSIGMIRPSGGTIPNERHLFIGGLSVKYIKLIGLSVLLIALGICVPGLHAFADAKTFETKETQLPLCEYNLPMSPYESGDIYNYQIEEILDKQDNYYMSISEYSYADNKVKKALNIACYDDYVDYVAKNQNNQQTVVVSSAEGKGKLRLTTYNKNGKKKKSFIDTFTKKDGYTYNMSLKDMLIKEKKLYYVYTKDGKYAHIRCLNRLSGKLQYDISLKTKGAKQIQELKICNNRVYVLTDTSVILFSLKGKKQMIYKLPGGINHVHTYLEGTFYSNADDISVSGKYIYYVNENGVFRCNTNQKKGFKIYYDTQNDPFFSQCRIFDLCAGKNGNFNIMFIEKTNIDLNMPTKLVEYIR